jgi:predicted phosphoribosyltransferase
MKVDPTYEDREEAALALAHALRSWRGAHPLVVAIPRGAVPMAATIARELGGDLDIVLVRKLTAPRDPEFAVGSLDETGWTYVAPHARAAGADAVYVQEEVRNQLATIRKRRERYTPGRGPRDARGRVVIVVDDGLASGATMIAALHSLRARCPRQLICAVPVASNEALSLVRPLADEVICLETPEFFHSVGQAYRRFAQVSDEEVIAALRSD